MKRFFTRFFFLVAMLACATGANAYVNGDRLTIDGITYQVKDASAKTLYVVAISTEKTGEVTIPAKVYDGKDLTFTVVSLGYGNGISLHRGITGFILPNTLEIINYNAFYNTSITSIHLPASVNHFDTTALWNIPEGFKEITVDPGNPYFEAQDGILYTKGKKRLIYVPRGKDVNATFVPDEAVEEIGACAFYNQKDVTRLEIGKNIKTLELAYNRNIFDCESKIAWFEVDPANEKYCSIDGVIYNKDKTTLVHYPYAKMDEEFRVPNGVTSISTVGCHIANFKVLDLNQVETLGDHAITSPKLEDIHIPATLAEIPEGSIDGSNIQNLYVADGNPTYSDIDGVLFNKDKTTLIKFPAGRKGDYTVPESTERIAEQAFQLTKLKTVILNEGLETIGNRAFYNSNTLTAVTIPTTVTSIADEVFARTPKLATVTFAQPSQLKSMGTNVFYVNNSLTTITLPTSLKTTRETFNTCYALEEIIIPNGSQLETIGGYFANDCSRLKRVVFEGSCDNLTLVNTCAFDGDTSLEYINLPKSVETIGNEAFRNCKNLKKVEFADDAALKNIRKGAFADCGLESITIPGKIVTIEPEAFRNCDVLETVSLPQSTTSVSPTAFKGCLKLKEFIVDENNTRYSSVQGYLCSKDKSTLELFPPGMAREDFTLLPPSLTKIGDNAFYECGETFTNICIPAKVEQIGERAFGLDASLQSIAFLGDELIDPDKIAQGENVMAIDNGTQAPDMFRNITIYVRKEAYQNFVNKHKGKGDKYDTYYSQFKGMKTSFYAQRTTDDGQDELLPMSNTAANLLGTQSTAKVYIVPETVTNTEDGATYAVNLIGDYAFENASENIKEVVVKSKVGYIGSMAFVTETQTVDGKVKPLSSTIEQVVFTANEPAEWMSRQYFGLTEDFKEFLPSQKIYVKKSKCEAYKNAWTDFTEQIDYKIPGIKINTKYGTFSREFDVDLAEFKKETGNGDVIAFAAVLEGLKKGKGDYGESEYHVRMNSLQSAGVDGTYIPAGTGVLLKCFGSDMTADNYFYTIGESDVNAAAESAMIGVTINDQQVKDTEKNIYVMSGGVFKALNGKTVTMPLHKAYLKLENSVQGAKLVFCFDDEATGISSLVDGSEVMGDGQTYNLQGVRVSDAASKGIYIKNGKKFVVK